MNYLIPGEIITQDGDIELNADGGKVTMKDDSTTLFGFQNNYINFALEHTNRDIPF